MSNSLKNFSELPIDWSMTPEQAVIEYLDWSTPDWTSNFIPDRSVEDVTYYFVLDTWGKDPVIRLIKRTVEGTVYLNEKKIPEDLKPSIKNQLREKGIFAPNEMIISWIKQCMGIK